MCSSPTIKENSLPTVGVPCLGGGPAATRFGVDTGVALWQLAKLLAAFVTNGSVEQHIISCMALQLAAAWDEPDQAN